MELFQCKKETSYLLLCMLLVLIVGMVALSGMGSNSHQTRGTG
jgi:hypothetical protein